MVLTLDDILRTGLEECAERIRSNIETTGLMASGRTQASIRVEVSDGVGTIYGRRAFGTLERGRRPGKTPLGFVGIIKQWMADKGITATPIPYIRQASARWSPKYTAEERGINAAAGAIAHSIRTQGTSLYRSGGREDVYTPPITEAVRTIRRQAAGLYRDEILNDLRRLKTEE